jgi:3'-phosphoadenosine 5'-phosphosulfate sulfotransferase (PAPS reductase)/FAD synthetase
MSATLFDHLYEHEGRSALQLSGGRDSMAMLLSLDQECLGKLHRVYHLDSGDSYPETRNLIAYLGKLLGDKLVVIRGRVHETQEEFGWPSDVLHAGHGWPQEGISNNLRLIDRHDCCLRSIMSPLHERMESDGITLLLRGQRLSDEPKSPVQHGETVNGITILYPIQDWTDEQVNERCGEFLPPYYREGVTSAPDCMHCTAWLEHKAMPYLTKHHPVVAGVVHARLLAIRQHVRPFMTQLEESIPWASA